MTIIRDIESPQRVVIKGDGFVKVISVPTTRLTVVQAPASGGGGSSMSTYEWSPSSAQATWLVPHNLHKHPSVTVVDSNGLEVQGKVIYLSQDLISVEFSAPVIGTVYLN